MVKIETDLMKEMKSLKKKVSRALMRQDLLLKAFIPEVMPTREELKIMKMKKEFVSEKDLFKALR